MEGKFGTFIVLLDSDCMSCFTFTLFVTIFFHDSYYSSHLQHTMGTRGTTHEREPGNLLRLNFKYNQFPSQN